MKQTRLLVLILLTIVGAVAAAVTPPTDLSLRGIVEWVGVGGHIASGTGSLPAVGPKGARYDDLSNVSRVIEYRSNGSYWKPLSTWNHSQLDNLFYASSGHGLVPMAYGGTGATNATDARTNLDVFSTASTTALIDDLSGVTEVASARENLDVYSTGETDQLIAQTIASMNAELDPMNYQENYDVIASDSALIVPLSGRTYVGIQNIDEVKNIHVYPNGLVASSGPANLILYAGETWYQRLTDSVPVAFYASEATPIVIFQGK